MCGAKANVRFTPNSDRESRHPQPAISALPPKATLDAYFLDFRFGPEGQKDGKPCVSADSANADRRNCGVDSLHLCGI